MKIYSQAIFVDDLKEARRFYGGLLHFRRQWDEERATAYDCGTILIVKLDPSPDSGHKLSGRFTGCTFAVDSIDATYQQWKAKGVRFLGRPEERKWGGMAADFCDPSGNVLTLLSGTGERGDTSTKEKAARS